MSLFDHDVNDSLDRMFDLNHDGKIDSGEQSFMYYTYDKTINTSDDADRKKESGTHTGTSDSKSAAQGIFYIISAIVIFIIFGLSCASEM